MENYEIRMVRNAIIEILNSADSMPLEVKRLILSEIYSDVTSRVEKNIIESATKSKEGVNDEC